MCKLTSDFPLWIGGRKIQSVAVSDTPPGFSYEAVFKSRIERENKQKNIVVFIEIIF